MRIVFVQLKSSDTSESCNISFHKVSNTINSINPLKYSLHYSKLSSSKWLMWWHQWWGGIPGMQDWHPGALCSLFLSTLSKNLCEKTWSLIFKVSSSSFTCFCKCSWERANVVCLSMFPRTSVCPVAWPTLNIYRHPSVSAEGQFQDLRTPKFMDA